MTIKLQNVYYILVILYIYIWMWIGNTFVCYCNWFILESFVNWITITVIIVETKRKTERSLKCNERTETTQNWAHLSLVSISTSKKTQKKKNKTKNLSMLKYLLYYFRLLVCNFWFPFLSYFVVCLFFYFWFDLNAVESWFEVTVNFLPKCCIFVTPMLFLCCCWYFGVCFNWLLLFRFL